MVTASNAQKTHFTKALNEFAAKEALDYIHMQGRSLPAEVVAANGSIVTVKFLVQSPVFTMPQVTMPAWGPQWMRVPYQAGDKGLVVPSDVYLGGASGLGGGTADLSLALNLSALVFIPIGNVSFRSVDGNVTTIYGPNGVTLEDQNSKCVFNLTPTGVTISINGTLVCTIDSTGISTPGNVTAASGTASSVDLLHHLHSSVQTGGGQSGPPVAGT